MRNNVEILSPRRSAIPESLAPCRLQLVNRLQCLFDVTLNFSPSKLGFGNRQGYDGTSTRIGCKSSRWVRRKRSKENTNTSIDGDRYVTFETFMSDKKLIVVHGVVTRNVFRL